MAQIDRHHDYVCLSLFAPCLAADESTPPMPVTVPRWEALAAHATHYAFFTLMIGMPLLGWIMVSASPLNILPCCIKRIYGRSCPLSEMDNKQAIGHAANNCMASLLMCFAVFDYSACRGCLEHHLFRTRRYFDAHGSRFMTGILNRIRGQRLSAIALLVCVAWNSIGTGERLDSGLCT